MSTESSRNFPVPTKSQHGLLNQYDCGCQVRRDGSGGHFIHMCPLHDAAPELLEALRRIQKLVRPALVSDLCKQANEAIRKAESK